MLVYAVGDVHGEREALEAILAMIDRDRAGRPAQIVLIGDYIDRGPDSSGCLRLVRSLVDRGAVCLRGNHEDMAAKDSKWSHEDRAFMKSLPLFQRIEDVLFVHAGVRPGVPIEKQTERDLLWIRSEWLAHDGPAIPGVRLIVHGHSPVSEPDVRAHSINIDTGACFGGPLTCAVLDGARCRFLFWRPEALPAWHEARQAA